MDAAHPDLTEPSVAHQFPAIQRDFFVRLPVVTANDSTPKILLDNSTTESKIHSTRIVALLVKTLFGSTVTMRLTVVDDDC